MDKINLLCVEDGSVDIDNLEEGLHDGKVVVYRQGAKPPYILEVSVPKNNEFLSERTIDVLVEIASRCMSMDIMSGYRYFDVSKYKKLLMEEFCE